MSRPIEIKNKKKVRFLEPVLKCWIRVHKCYCKALSNRESIYWCNERGNVGALSAAAWLADMVALEEYPHKTKEPGKLRDGKPDLYVNDKKGHDAFIEAKLHWWGWATKPETEITHVNKHMEAACEQAKGRKDTEVITAIGAVFIVPGVLDTKEFGSKQIDLIRKKCTPDAMASYFVDKTHVMSESDESGTKRYYPGVVLIMKVVKCESAPRPYR